MLQILFLIITLLFFLSFHLLTEKDKRVFSITLLWCLIISGLSIFGFFHNTDTTPPRFLVVLVGNILFVALLYKILKSVTFDYNRIMILHTLRIPVEVILYFLFLESKVPKLMTFKGFNFDIVIGVSALMFYVLSRFFKIKLGKKLLLIWNLIGIIFLVNIVLIAILSAPLPIQQISFEQPNIAVLFFPYILLPSYIVPIVFLIHIMLMKKLLK